MSLTVVVKGSDGVALATDSRRTALVPGLDRYCTFDGEQKLWAFAAPHDHVAVVVYGYADLACSLSAWHTEFARELPAERLSTEAFARQLGAFLERQHQPRMVATIGGVDEDGTARVFVIDTADGAEPVEHHAGAVGITYGGQREFAERLLQGYDARVPDTIADGLEIGDEYRDGFGRQAREALAALAMQIPLATFDLAACAAVAEFFVRTTAEAQRFIVGIRGVGGPIDVVTVTGGGLRWLARKESSAVPHVAWHGAGELVPVVTNAPADGVVVATFTVPTA